MDKKVKIKSIIKFLQKGINEIIYDNLYLKPKLLLSVALNPKQLIEESYFPELDRRTNCNIIFNRIVTILRYGTIDEYYYMYGLDVKRDISDQDYVTYREFRKKRDSLNLSNPHNSSSVLRNKLLFHAIASSLQIPTPKVVAYSNNGTLMFLSPHQTVNDDWKVITEHFKESTVFIKPLDGECGVGIIKCMIHNDQLFVNSAIITPSELKNMCKKGRYIIQKAISQHPEMNRMYDKSVNTIRMTTVKNLLTQEIEILSPTLRVGANGNFVDNFSKGGVIISMDPNTGKLADWGFFKPQYGFKAKFHPDTNVEFATFKIPFYNQAKELAKQFHSFLDLHSIGWDIAITEDGPIFIEGNDNWEINLPQTFENPLKKEFKRLFCQKLL